MPLVIICGYPSSGKSQKVSCLESYLKERIQTENLLLTVKVVDDNSLGFNRSTYAHQTDEKKLRGALLTAAERLVTKNDIIILDSNNYIKGLRYQLYCVARAIATPHCVIHVGAPKNLAQKWNLEREDGYDEKVFEELINRFEEPIGSNRWDSPLFTTIHDDDPPLPFSSIWDALILKKAPPPNLSTVNTPLSNTNYLYELDKLVSKVASELINNQNDNPGGNINVESAKVKVELRGKHISLAEIKRLKRAFINLSKAKNLQGISLNRIPDMFVEFLNQSFQN